jgi:hypothetical protein
VKSNPEFEKFDGVMKKVLSVSRDELQKREKEWKRTRAANKGAKSSTAKNREKLIPPEK